MTTTLSTEALYQKNSESFLGSKANSLFDVHDSIWTYNCPCPSPQHNKKNKHHICRFKQSAATSIISDDPTSHILSEEFNALACFFSQRSSVAAAATTVSTPIAVDDTNITIHIEEEPYTTYSHFMDFMAERELVVRSRQCYHTGNCHTYMCTFGHSVSEMIDVFKDERVKWFYKEAVIKSHTYAPHTKEMSVTSVKKMRCPSTNCAREQPDITVRLMLYTGYDNYLIYPYITVKCNTCRRLINAPVYK